MNGYVCRSGHISVRRYDAPFTRRYSSQKKDYCTFVCKYTAGGNSGGLMQGILYNDRSCLIGMDVWRLLNRMDMCQYPFKRYVSVEEANVTIEKMPKRYYMEQ